LERQWKELNAKLSGIDRRANELTASGGRDNILMVCYTGDTARIATSTLRAREIQAFSLKGGFQELR
jgi:cysteine synthase A